MTTLDFAGLRETRATDPGRIAEIFALAVAG